MDKEIRLTPEEFCDRCWGLVEEYTEGVLSGEIVTGVYIKKQVARFKEDIKSKKYDYRVEKVDKVFKFFSFLNIDHRDNYVQFPMMNWQAFMIAAIYGFYEKDSEKRKVREVLLFLGRKNSKTCFAACLQLFGLLGDGVSVPQSLLLANTAKQASNALNFAKDIIVHTPQLKKRLTGQRSRIIFNDLNRQGFCEIFSTIDPARLEGFSPSCCILDEIHGFTDGNIYNAVKTGIGARLNPLLFITTTAGNKNASFCNEYLNYHKNVLDDKIADDKVFSLIYQPDLDDDLSNPECWAKANPSLGKIISLDDLKATFNQAQHSYVDKFNFITKHLNLFFDTPDVWIPEDDLRKLFAKFDIEKFRGRECYVGMDLSKNTDLSSIVFTFPPTEDDPKFSSYPIFFMANRPDNFIRKNGKDLSPWLRDGQIIKCESKVIDLEQIYEKIIEMSEVFNIISVQYDSFNAPQLVSKLKEYGITCIDFPQNAKKFNGPLKMLEQLVYDEKIEFYNPVLLWNFANVVLYVDTNANIKIIKNDQQDSVDGIVALGMSLGGYLDSTYGAEIVALNSYLNSSKKEE